MATWTDGAAYAPTERPDGFAAPEVEPLAQAPEEPAPTPGAVPAPQGFNASPQVPLEQIHVEQRSTRDPGRPFTTTRVLLTGEPERRGTPRNPRQPFPLQPTTLTKGPPLPPPSGPPLQLPPGQAVPGSPPPPSQWPRQASPPQQGPGWPQQAPGRDGWPPQPPPAGAPQHGRWAAPVPPPRQPGRRPIPADEQPAWFGEFQEATDRRPPPRRPDPTTRMLLVVATALFAVGIYLPGAAPVLMIVGGVLAQRTRPVGGGLGTAAVWAGALLLLFSFFAGDTLLPVLASVVFGVWGVVLVYRVQRESK